jgi:hypothetical protein
MTPDPITALATALPALLVSAETCNSNNIVYGNTYPTVTVTYTTPATMPIDG